MKQLGRIFIFAFLVLFATGTLAHAANSTIMTVKTAMTGSPGADAGDCDDCGGDYGSSVCDNTCMAQLLAISVDSNFNLPPRFDAAVFVVTVDMERYTGPPDPDPPRKFLPA